MIIGEAGNPYKRHSPALLAALAAMMSGFAAPLDGPSTAAPSLNLPPPPKPPKVRQGGSLTEMMGRLNGHR